MVIRTSFYIALSMFLSVASMAQGISFQSKTLKDALQRAEEEEKLVFVDAYTTWCGPCKWMAANIFPNEKLGIIYDEGFISVQIDMEKGEGLDIAQQYQVNAYPTLLYLNSKGEVLMRSVGASQEIQDYIELARTAQDPEGNMLFLTAEFEKNRTNPTFMSRYLEVFSRADMLKNEVVDDYFALVPFEKWTQAPYWQQIQQYVQGVDFKTFAHLIDHKEEVRQIKGDSADAFFSQQILSHLYNKRYRARHEDQLRDFREELNRWQALWPYDSSISFKLNLFDAELSKDMDLWMELAAKGTQQFVWNDGEYLNNLAWSVYTIREERANIKELHMALYWADRAVELYPEHYVLDTQARLRLAVGDEKGAVQAAVEAARKADEQGLDAEEYHQFVQEIKAAKR